MSEKVAGLTKTGLLTLPFFALAIFFRYSVREGWENVIDGARTAVLAIALFQLALRWTDPVKRLSIAIAGYWLTRAESPFVTIGNGIADLVLMLILFPVLSRVCVDTSEFISDRKVGIDSMFWFSTAIASVVATRPVSYFNDFDIASQATSMLLVGILHFADLAFFVPVALFAVFGQKDAAWLFIVSILVVVAVMLYAAADYVAFAFVGQQWKFRFTSYQRWYLLLLTLLLIWLKLFGVRLTFVARKPLSSVESRSLTH